MMGAETIGTIAAASGCAIGDVIILRVCGTMNRLSFAVDVTALLDQFNMLFGVSGHADQQQHQCDNRKRFHILIEVEKG